MATSGPGFAMGDFLGAIAVVDEAADQIHDPGAIALHERAESRLGAHGAALHDVFIGQLGEVELFQA